jgi:hypothetical protein
LVLDKPTAFGGELVVRKLKLDGCKRNITTIFGGPS